MSTGPGLVALGDSITNGRGTMVMGVTPKSWAQWLAEALDLPYTCRAGDGAVTADVVAEQLPRLTGAYDVACVYTGVNDVRSVDWDAAAYERDLRTVLAALTGHAGHVVTLTIPLDLGRPPAGAKVGVANEIIRGLAREAGAACGELEGLRGPRAMMPDAVHPTALGQLRIADAAAAALAAGRPSGAGHAVRPGRGRRRPARRRPLRDHLRRLARARPVAAVVGAMSGSLDAVVVGGGHNGLVAAAYLARAGLRVRVCERLPEPGGAAANGEPWPGVDARLSRYAYLVSLLPERIVADLGLRFTARSRPFGSCTPAGDRALLVERRPGERTARSFAEVTGSPAEFEAWQEFHATCERVAQAVWPTLLEPLPDRAQLRARCGEEAWDALVERPLGEVLEATFADDLVRGLVLTDALIGTATHAHDASLRQNRCFLYHVIGGGTGEWRVPVGGMGALTRELTRAALEAGAEIATRCEVTNVETDGRTAEVTTAGGERVAATHVLAGVAPHTLASLLGDEPPEKPVGSSAKVNLLVTRLPRLRCGADPAEAFAGTFHVDEGYAQLQGHPDRLPFEVYCHSLTDPSIVGDGLHALTAFALNVARGRRCARRRRAGARRPRPPPRRADPRLPGDRRGRPAVRRGACAA